MPELILRFHAIPSTTTGSYRLVAQKYVISKSYFLNKWPNAQTIKFPVSAASSE